MNNNNVYLNNVIQKYQTRSLSEYSYSLNILRASLIQWASSSFLNIIESGSRPKGTAVSLSSDVDYLVSLSADCYRGEQGLKGIYQSLFNSLKSIYPSVRKQNVSVRVTLPGLNPLLPGLEVDITPGRKQSGNTDTHSLWVSKHSSWRQTNVRKHINDVRQSGRSNEIKLIKIWRELNKLEFPSIYIEYLLMNVILKGRPITSDNITSLESNLIYILKELAKPKDNPLLSTLIDPANTGNVLSDLLSKDEKHKIYSAAQDSISKSSWGQIVW